MPELEPIEARPAVRIPRQTEDRNETGVRFAPLSGILSGPIFTRTRDIIAANMTDLLDRSEDPARMIRMIINEMEETLVEVRATAARSIADIKEMRRACIRLDDLQHGWTEKAELALEKGREDLARAALGEKQKAAEMAESLHAEVAQIEQVLRGYEADIARLQAKLAEARARQNAIASRFESALTRARANEVMHGSRAQEAFAKFEILERRADFAEGRADALGLAGPKSLEEEIAELRSVEAVDAELDALKAALAARN
jgi:phage shock protein A